MKKLVKLNKNLVKYPSTKKDIRKPNKKRITNKKDKINTNKKIVNKNNVWQPNFLLTKQHYLSSNKNQFRTKQKQKKKAGNTKQYLIGKVYKRYEKKN